MDVAAIHEELSARAQDDRFFGAVRIDRAGVPLLRAAYGWASLTWRVPCSLDTRFDTASITKLFTAAATLQQRDAGAFTLETSVIDYLELTGTAISPEVTPYQLLTHTSGIGDDADEEAGENYADVFLSRPNYSVRETADFLPQFVHKPPNFAPGQGCRYCNCSYILLGMMIERATGMSFRKYVTEHIFGPAGMQRSGFFSMDVVEPDVAEGLTPIVAEDRHESESAGVTEWRRSIYSYPPIGSPDGGAHVTVDDLVNFHEALVRGALLGPDSTAAMLVPHEDYRQRPPGLHRTGFGFEFETIDGRVRSYWKEGINTGASGMLKHYPKPGVTVAILSNLEEGVWEPLKMIDELVGA